MDTKVDVFPGAATPGSSMVEDVVGTVSRLMVLMGGIEAISAVSYKMGSGSRLNVTISPFPDAPAQIVSQGIVIKDALAQILSVANVAKIVVTPSKKELQEIRDGWKSLVEDANVANEGSGQDFSSGKAK